MRTLLNKLTIIAPLLAAAGLVALAVAVSGWFWLAYFAAGAALLWYLRRHQQRPTAIRGIVALVAEHLVGYGAFAFVWGYILLLALAFSWYRDLKRKNLRGIIQSPTFWTYATHNR